MKLTPFALRSRSSCSESPSITDGVLTTSSAVNDHWFGSGISDCARDALGDWPREAPGRGGEVRKDRCGGVGAAGGTSFREAGDAGGCSDRGLFIVGGW